MLAAAPAQAQFQVEFWTTDNGLPQNTVRSILQTRDGYLWLATLDGLVRYDGVRFTVFNKNNTDGIDSSRFTQLILDGHDELWSATEGGAVTRYNRGGFQTYNVTDGSPGNLITQLVLNNAGELLVFTGQFIARWDGKQFAPYTPVAGETKDSKVLWGRDGAFWYSEGHILHRFKAGQITDYRLPGASTSDGRATIIGKLFEDSRGRLWVGTNNAGLFLYENEKLTRHVPGDGLPAEHVSVQFEDRGGNLWAASSHGALIIGDGGTRRLTKEQGLSDDVLTTLYEDREGNIWVGSLFRGLNRLSRQSVTFYGRKDGLEANIVRPIYEDRDGDVWIGGQDLTRYSRGRFSPVTGRPSSLSKEVTAIHQDRGGRLWFGHWAGLYYYADGKFTDFTAPLGQKAAVTDIHEDRGGALWFATSNVGLYRYQNGALTRITKNEGLSSNDVKIIHEASDGSLWFGTYGGLSRLKDNQFVSFTTADGLASNLVRSIYEDADGVFWIGSYDGGLTRMKDGRFTRYTSRDGLFNDGVFQILEDGRGNFWMSSNRGIYRASKQQLNDFAAGKIGRIDSIAYGKADGMLETECNGGLQPAGIRARDGRLWFPTQQGVAVIAPDAVVTNPHAPPVHIESYTLDGVRAGADGRGIGIPPGTKNLEIAYTGLSFYKPEQVRFKYKLEGLDRDWVDAVSRRTAYYSHIPPGDYVFRVVAANSDGFWNPDGASIRVKVLAPFYRTWWFLVSLALASVGAAYWFYRRRVAQLEKEKAGQEAYSRQLIESQEQERRRIAVELHDGLGQSLVVIKNRALIGLDTPDNHERLLSQMTDISEAASAAIVEVRGIARNLHPYQIDYLGLTTALRTMISSAADASNIEFVADICELDGELPKEAEINLYRIVQEAVNNVVKHSAATTATVTLRKSGQHLELLVADNGRGFSPDAGRPARGLGLVGISERAKMLGAQHEVRTTVEHGTTVSLQMTLTGTKHEG